MKKDAIDQVAAVARRVVEPKPAADPHITNRDGIVINGNVAGDVNLGNHRATSATTRAQLLVWWMLVIMALLISWTMGTIQSNHATPTTRDAAQESNHAAQAAPPDRASKSPANARF